jgi:hypothetical protein
MNNPLDVISRSVSESPSDIDLKVAIATEVFQWKSVSTGPGNTVTGYPRRGIFEAPVKAPNWPSSEKAAEFLERVILNGEAGERYLHRIKFIAGDTSPSARQKCEAVLFAVRNKPLSA